MTLDELRTIMRQCGVEDGVDLDGDILDRTWAELGYDSLAVLEITTAVQHQAQNRIPEDELGDLHTPRLLLSRAGEQNRAA
ncbi:acyl carrier protein [Streptomyces morookaense]|uniref:Acyl carrier protein n=1 Tax=Streptomyces morookaense TaxID=1970 RepID=A0A7Y7B521_STRMO|nr:acyl carrier protein [Streptomyces morookaense]NVK79153.1 acyl carrier protein [Streptomyces morookaense]GHF28146.1 actinorhodin polyketide synthase [Streptomyces morookaense]